MQVADPGSISVGSNPGSMVPRALPGEISECRVRNNLSVIGCDQKSHPRLASHGLIYSTAWNLKHCKLGGKGEERGEKGNEEEGRTLQS